MPSENGRPQSDGPRKPLTAQQRRIADGIHRELSYEEIGKELNISPHTVRQHVRAMALLFDEPACLPPRMRILMWVRHHHWEVGNIEPPKRQSA